MQLKKICGDCSSNCSSSNFSANRSSTKVTQSPEYNYTTVPKRKLVEGIGYTKIFESQTRKFELSSQKTMLRKTVLQNGINREYLYSRINDTSTIDKIEYKSENWKAPVGGRYDGYWVLEQQNASNRLTGFIKIVEKSKAVRGVLSGKITASDEDWIYYGRRSTR